MSRSGWASFARSSFSLGSCASRVAVSISLALLVVAGTSYGQNSRLKRMEQGAAAPGKASSTVDKPSAATVPAPAPSNPAPVPAPSNQVPEQLPAQPPVISWDGNQLTIDAENSTLSDILLGIRARTGASIEMPPSTNRERVAAHLGPAPIREVLSSLLYGTDFNYIIQSADGDESGLGKVILSSREPDKTEDLSASNSPGDRKIRLMPGYAAPGKRDFEVAHEDSANSAEQQPDSSAAAGQAANQDSTTASAATGNSDGARASGSADQQAQPTTSAQSSDTGASSSGSGLQVAEQSPSSASANSMSQSGGGDGSAISRMEQDLQHMYEQRRQIQAQQNHTQAQGPGN